MNNDIGIPLVDIAALAAFAALWVGYTVMAEHRKVREHTLSAVMAVHRETWMRSMCERDNRIADTSLMGNLMRSVSFFASATILIMGGLVALMGAGEHAFVVYQDMPFAPKTTSLEAFEMKVLLLIGVFVYTFFQFTWALRQFNYCCILMGTAPPVDSPEAEKDAFAALAAKLQDLAANTFNRGLRAYYFALAMMMWFVHAGAFVAASALVVAILYRREFNSKSLQTLRKALPKGGDTP
ncbi:DUF599 domain-containing protein [Magnetospirillum sp. 64-120]|uniref:DUF599 domain-containing protein n=1 Tax=Magnetospirillum sp. 64-120 TaxID=1895778 RepID=UPI00092C9A45|nr:DUF599 domain-containing protein [Magnetospirillum sp. 64-120]OJX81310.1 MAG: hypothetical protein BGO92_07265 [Magnetospirillum sp. 64-120]